MKAATETKTTKARKDRNRRRSRRGVKSRNPSRWLPRDRLKRGTCPTLTDKSDLGYEIGVDSRGEVQLRVVENSGSGSFSDDWVALQGYPGGVRQCAEVGTPCHLTCC